MGGRLRLLDGAPSSRWASAAVIWDGESPPAMGASACLLATGVWITTDGVSADRWAGRGDVAGEFPLGRPAFLFYTVSRPE